jgi:hypothetical protein
MARYAQPTTWDGWRVNGVTLNDVYYLLDVDSGYVDSQIMSDLVTLGCSFNVKLAL